MDKFSALSDPTRRKIIEMLAQQGPLSASEIGEQFPVSPPAISQHLKVLREARLVTMEKRAQQRIYNINPDAILEVEKWATQMTQLWNQRFDVLDQLLEAEKRKNIGNQIERKSEVETQTTKELTITRVFDAPRELVFKTWIDPHLLARWFGPNMFTIPVCELDLRPGGALLIHMRGPDGVDYPMTGVFQEIVPPERIVFNSSAVMDESGSPQLETLTTVTFAEENGKTKMTLHVVVEKASPLAEGALSGMSEGWSQSLDKLAGLLIKL